MESHPSSLAGRHEGRPPHVNPPPPPPLGSLYLGSDGQRLWHRVEGCGKQYPLSASSVCGSRMHGHCKITKNVLDYTTDTNNYLVVSGREIDLIVVQYMEYELELVLHSLQSVKSS